MKTVLSLLQRILLPVLLLVVPTLHAQQSTGTDPKHPDWQWFPILDTMHGTLNVPGRSEQFGYEIHALGDINGDSIMDFGVNRRRIDTQFTVNSYMMIPKELLVFRGVKGKLPSAASGERIGLTEIGSDIRFLATGDFDGDHHRDLVVQARVYNDSSLGNTNAQYELYTIIVFWGNSSDRFSLNDTTQLQLSGIDNWFSRGMLVTDWGNDGADDIVTWTFEAGYTYGKVFMSMPQMHGFVGVPGERWGRNGVPRTPSWRWWNPPEFNTLGPLIDQDGDGAMDLPLHLNQDGGPGISRVSILYGTLGGGFPDTNNIEAITFEVANGRNSQFNDVTGDGMVELLLDAGSQEMVKIYAGRRRQRLQEQYGSGNDDPQPGKGWWYRPWAVLWSANKLDDGWTGSGFTGALALDGNRDGINDIWRASAPYFLCYLSGEVLDSLIDGIIESPGARNFRPVGDITGTDAEIIAIRDESVSGIVFYHATRSLPETGVYRTLPHIPAGIEEEGETMRGREDETLGLQAVPNPAQGKVKITWRSENLSGTAVISIRDVLGREVVRLGVPTRQGQAMWNPGEIVGGAYFITLTIAGHTETTRVILR